MDWTIHFDKLMAERLPKVKVLREEPMSRHTSFRLGGPAKRLACPENGGQLAELMALAGECGAETLVIGRGTNLLIPDEGVDRLVIDTSAAMQAMALEGERITAEAGVTLTRLAELACRNGLTGAEFAHGIPGTLGGAVCMNAGAYGGEMDQILETVTVLYPDGSIRTLGLEELELGYRRSLFTRQPELVVLSATVRLQPGAEAEIRAKMQELMGRRKSTQPLEYPSAGSTFKRPAGYFAGTLIDQCGLKGLRVGGAQVSEKHAGFLINIGGATFADVTALMEQVRQRVFDATGVLLEPEVRIIR